jgi:hypothetical protein
MGLFRRKKMAPPYQPERAQPIWPGAYMFTMRSVPRHHDGIKAAIESTGTARAWFSEPLAYLRGQGVSLFRVEAKDLAFLDNLYRWWAETERAEAFTFEIALYVNNTTWLADLRGLTPEAVRRIIEEHAPRVPDDPAAATLTPRTGDRV